MTQFLVDEDFVREHREMFRWFRSQQQAESLSERGQRIRKDGGLVPVVLTESLGGTIALADANRLVVKNPKRLAVLVSVGDTADGGTFALSSSGTTSGDIAYDATAQDVQTEMDILFGPGNTTVLIGGGAWLIRQNFEGTFNLTGKSGKLGGSQQVSVIKTVFNSISADKLKVFQAFPNQMGETLPAGTIAWVTLVPGVGYCVVRHNKERPTFVAVGKADGAITAGSSGTVSVYRGTQDTTVNITATNISDQQADSAADVLIFEMVDQGGDLYYTLVPLDCPA